MKQAIFTTPQSAVLPITLYYDHSCRLCRSEIENLSARDKEGSLHLVDCSAPQFDTSDLPIDQATLMNCIHARDAQGQWLKSTDVFVVCYRVAQLQTIARAFEFAKPLAERVYPWIVRNRYILSSLGIHKLFNALTHRHLQRQAQTAWANSQACKDGACELTLHTQSSDKART
jgi:predicted DCC family thiol-disulfide oxidoreductase YuxK